MSHYIYCSFLNVNCGIKHSNSKHKTVRLEKKEERERIKRNKRQVKLLIKKGFNRRYTTLLRSDSCCLRNVDTRSATADGADVTWPGVRCPSPSRRPANVRPVSAHSRVSSFLVRLQGSRTAMGRGDSQLEEVKRLPRFQKVCNLPNV